MNNVEIGEYTNGQKFARLKIDRDGFTAQVEGRGKDADQAIEDAHRQLLSLIETAREAAEAMDV